MMQIGRNTVLVLAALAVAVVLTFLFYNPLAPRSAYTIGVMLPLTGDVASLGQPTLQGIQIAVDEENRRRRPDAQIVLNVQDTQARADQATTAYAHLQGTGVAVIIGPLTSRESTALLPRLQRVAVISPGASASAFDGQRDLFFRVELSDLHGGMKEAELMYARGIRSVAILYMNDEYGQGLQQVFTTRFEELGGQVELSHSFTSGETEFRPTLQRVASANVDALLAIGIEEVVNIVRQSRQLSLDAEIWTTPIFENADYVARLGADANGVRLVRYGTFDASTYDREAAPTNDGVSWEFARAYRQRFGVAPTYYSALGYDAAQLAIATLNRSGGRMTAAEFTESLQEGAEVNGASGLFRIDQNGDVDKPIMLLTVENGQFVPLGN